LFQIKLIANVVLAFLFSLKMSVKLVHILKINLISKIFF